MQRHGVYNTSYEKSRKRRISGSSSMTKLLLIISSIVTSLWVVSLYLFEHHISDHFREYSKQTFVHNSNSLYNSDHDQAVGVTSIENKIGVNKRTNKKDLSAFLTMYGEHRFQTSFDALPLWLQEYFNWHREQTSSNNPDTKYIVMSCLPEDTCGGLSDRLRPMPFFLFMAKYTKRVLCINWKKNYGLDEFLQPIPNVGIEWRCPKDVDDYYDIQQTTHDQRKAPSIKFGTCSKRGHKPYAKCIESEIKRVNKNIHAKYASIDLWSRAADPMNEANLLVQQHSYGFNLEAKAFLMPYISGSQYPEMIEHIFRVMFEPIPVLARRINATMTKLGLVENDYVSTHARCRYPNRHLEHLTGSLDYDIIGGMKFEGNVKIYLVNILNNALECGHKLAPDLKLFMITDHNDATNYVISNDIVFDENGEKRVMRPVGIHRDEEVLHMEGNHTTVKAESFYSVFEDLLIMGGSRCVRYVECKCKCGNLIGKIFASLN